MLKARNPVSPHALAMVEAFLAALQASGLAERQAWPYSSRASSDRLPQLRPAPGARRERKYVSALFQLWSYRTTSPGERNGNAAVGAPVAAVSAVARVACLPLTSRSMAGSAEIVGQRKPPAASVSCRGTR
jgi:hypothetical protein